MFTVGKFVFYCIETETFEEFDTAPEAFKHAANYGDDLTRVIFKVECKFAPAPEAQRTHPSPADQPGS